MPEISLRNVCIEFPLYDGERNIRQTIFSKAVGGLFQKTDLTRPSIRALNDITLSIKAGDRVGLVGHNGSGKTTLLQTMAGIYTPVHGTISTKGKISSMFSTNLGMDMDDTGYRNIITCALAIGMTLSEINSKRNSIAEFCDLGEYLDLPVHCYSAGMAMRLAFAIATSIEPEILLLDEGIMVGDALFHSKAQKRVRSLMNQTEVLVLASHSPEMLVEWCDKGVLLEHGNVVTTDTMQNVLEIYQERTSALARES